MPTVNRMPSRIQTTNTASIARPPRGQGLPKALTVGVIVHGHAEEIDAEMVELAALAGTAGARVEDSMIQRVDRLDPATWIGRGKSREMAARIQQEGFHLIIFNGNLSPTQIRNLQDLVGSDVKILDRPGLILDIFARNARSRDAKLRVELAQLQYLLPRLAGLWRHLERQQGGIGTRGPGETQIEVDRRMARKRLSILQEQIDRMGRARGVQRSSRAGIPRVALVGYTNAGKSTLLNAFTRAGVLAENRLFSTLDTKTAAVVYPPQNGTSAPFRVLLSDTVGFIRHLPDHLFDAFLSTLDEVREADLVLHVLDVSAPEFRRHAEVVRDVLAKIAADRSVLTVLNKADRLDVLPDHLLREFPDSVFISAHTGMGLASLREAIRQKLTAPRAHALS